MNTERDNLKPVSEDERPLCHTPHSRHSANEEPLFLHELFETTQQTQLVLDLGCGNGSFDYSQYNIKGVALDNLMPTSLDSFQHNVRFVRGRASSLPLHNNCLDLVVSNWVLEHVQTPDNVLREIERVLKDGGFFYVTIPNSKSLEDRLYRRFYRDSGGHVQNYTFESFCRLVYSNTALKLTSYCEWPSGFTWIRTSRGRKLFSILLKAIATVKRLTNKNVLRKGGWAFLFKLEGKKGLRQITHVCFKCGSGVTIDPEKQIGVESNNTWRCSACGNDNSYI